MSEDPSTLSDGEIGAMAEALWRAELDSTAVDYPSHRYPEMTWADARAVARAVDALRRSDGHQQVGYKLGWTSQAMRDALGIDRPNWGTLWDYQLAHHRLAVLRHAKVEPELVFRAARSLSGPAVTVADVIDAADGWGLGHEIVHPRYPGFDFTWLDNTTDNSSSQAVVTGAFADPGCAPDLIEITFSEDGSERTGTGAEAMGSPAAAVAWLAKVLDEEETGIEAGHIVYTGGLAAPFDVRSGSTYRIESTVLPPVEFTAPA